MKKYVSMLVLCVLILLSGCGLTVTKVENTTASQAQNTAVTDKNTVTATTALVGTTVADTTAVTKTTTAKTTKKAQVKTAEHKTKAQVKNVTCTIEIECKTILDNLENLRPEKKAFLPQNGIILKKTTVSVTDGSTVFDVIKLACEKNTCPEECAYCRQSGIQLEHIYTPGYDSEYIRGIHQIYEKDCGTRSGWMYCVNGTFPNYGVNKYKVRNGDEIRFSYTCDLGDDIGNGYSNQ